VVRSWEQCGEREKQSFCQNKGRVGSPRVTDLERRANSDNSRKPLTVTQRKRKRVTCLSGAERQRRWRKRHREAHKAQQRAYRRRKRETEERDEVARSRREYQEARDRAAVATKAMQELEARLSAAEGMAKTACLSIERWLDRLPAEEASKHADLKQRLIDRERLSKEAAQVWEQLGLDPLTGNPLNSRRNAEPVQEPTPFEAWQARRKAAYEAPLQILSNGIIL
jgi:hypothetical protein